MFSPNSIAKTYIRYKDQWFFVSTIHRESSSPITPGMIYAETIAWELDPETSERGRIIYQGEAPKGTIMTHQWVIDQLHTYGEIQEDDN